MVKTLRRGKAITSDKTKIYPDASNILGKFNPDWKVVLDDPIDCSKPISDLEMEEMEDFLGKYGIGTHNASNEINDERENAGSVASEDIPEVEEWADEDESFFSDGLELLYSPGE